MAVAQSEMAAAVEDLNHIAVFTLLSRDEAHLFESDIWSVLDKYHTLFVG